MSGSAHAMIGACVFVLGAAALSAPTFASSSRDARRHVHHRHYAHVYRGHYYGGPSYSSSSFERIRANDYDPACEYCGYPDWARYALSPKR